jgi:hypothetical protein
LLEALFQRAAARDDAGIQLPPGAAKIARNQLGVVVRVLDQQYV